MKNQNDVYKLSNGVEIPCIGFGTWQTPDGDVAVITAKGGPMTKIDLGIVKYNFEAASGHKCR